MAPRRGLDDGDSHAAAAAVTAAASRAPPPPPRLRPASAALLRPPSALALDKSAALPSFLENGAKPDSPRGTFAGKGISVTVRDLTFEVIDNRPQKKKGGKGDGGEAAAANVGGKANNNDAPPEIVIHNDGGPSGSSDEDGGGGSSPSPTTDHLRLDTHHHHKNNLFGAAAPPLTPPPSPPPPPASSSRASRLLRALGGAAAPSRKPRLALLTDVTAAFPAGRLTALMGPSGSGKSTLLDLMSGRKTTGRVARGTILFAGQKASAPFLRRYAGYVEQFDTLLPVLTPREMLLYTAELKRPVSEPRAAKREAVEAVLDKLALRSCADVVVGSALHKGISGGQAKRTNIGIALVTSPRVLFLGERRKDGRVVICLFVLVVVGFFFFASSSLGR
jgi:ABC-type lipoprotein export system ATPase subunit